MKPVTRHPAADHLDAARSALHTATYERRDGTDVRVLAESEWREALDAVVAALAMLEEE